MFFYNMLLRVAINHTDNFIAVEPLVSMPFCTLKKASGRSICCVRSPCRSDRLKFLLRPLAVAEAKAACIPGKVFRI